MMAHEIFERWLSPLSRRIGRSGESILADGLLASDFPDSGVHIVFEDGSNLTFQHAFYLGDVEKRTIDQSICRVAVFSEHVGYHEFWVGPDDRIEVVSRHRKSLAELLNEYDRNVPYSEEDRAWEKMPAVGREFGSPDYEKLME